MLDEQREGPSIKILGYFDFEILCALLGSLRLILVVLLKANCSILDKFGELLLLLHILCCAWRLLDNDVNSLIGSIGTHLIMLPELSGLSWIWSGILCSFIICGEASLDIPYERRVERIWRLGKGSQAPNTKCCTLHA